VAERYFTQVLCPLCSSDPQDAEVKEEPTWFEAVCTICGSSYKVLIDSDKVKRYGLVG
jgi:transcription elongation factor Elf1